MRLSAVGENVHLWFVSLDRPPAPIAALAGWLSPEEHQRAARFHFARDRRRFVVRRGALRLLLGESLGLPPEQVSFAVQGNGKPVLAQGGIEFNASHSDELAVIALAGRRVGVDLERMRPGVPILRIAQVFAPREQEFIAARPPEEQLRTFYACWTCKEACVKALGVGLALSLQDFDVSAALTAAPGGVRVALPGDPPHELALVSLAYRAPYALALAAEPFSGEIVFHEWSAIG